jgi:hypothetical protein
VRLEESHLRTQSERERSSERQRKRESLMRITALQRVNVFMCDGDKRQARQNERERERAMAHFYLNITTRRKDKNGSVYPCMHQPERVQTHNPSEAVSAMSGSVLRIIYIKDRQMVCARRAALHCSPCHRLACSVQSLHTQSDVPTRHQTDTQPIRERKEIDSASKLP